MLASVTPVLLTLNEASNVGRTLAGLRWARRIVVLDSGSTDATEAIARGFANVEYCSRPFDTHAAQWHHAVHGCGVDTPWVLALDADYQLTAPALAELSALQPPEDVDGYAAGFVYCIHGRPIRSGLYPPVTVLYRRERARYVQDGHTQRVVVPGRVLRLRERLLHDDRKPLGDWLARQDRYARLEADKLLATPVAELRWLQRLRLLALPAPLLALPWCLVARGGLLDGPAGLHYAWQRTAAEALLALHLLDRRLGGPADDSSSSA